ncbi:MAG: hypothetical protein MI867_02455 [Pseudomonadales bacterium]|nr:hypothetical protein [Pseudomonadales bacterium]
MVKHVDSTSGRIVRITSTQESKKGGKASATSRALDSSDRLKDIIRKASAEGAPISEVVDHILDEFFQGEALSEELKQALIKSVGNQLSALGYEVANLKKLD